MCLCLGSPARAMQEKPQIVKICRHLGMVRPVACLVDRQRMAIKSLGFICSVGLVQQSRKIAEVSRTFGWSGP